MLTQLGFFSTGALPTIDILPDGIVSTLSKGTVGICPTIESDPEGGTTRFVAGANPTTFKAPDGGIRTCPFNKSGATPASVKLPTAGKAGVPEESSGIWPVNATDPASGVAVVAWPGICPVAKTDPVLGVTVVA